MWGYLDDPRLFFFVCLFFCDGCPWVPCLFWTVKLSTVLQKNPPCPADSAVFQHLLHIWTLSSSDCMILRSIFSHWGQLRDSNTTIKKGSNIHWCSRRKHDALRAGCWKLLNRMKIFNFFLLLKYNFFPFITALRKQQKILACFPEDKLSTIYLDLQIQKVFSLPALNASCFLLEHQWMFEPFLIVVFVSLDCPQSEKMDLKIIQSLLERV